MFTFKHLYGGGGGSMKLVKCLPFTLAISFQFHKSGKLSNADAYLLMKSVLKMAKAVF